MNNIFENAYFGKAYRTRRETKALFLRFMNVVDEDDSFMWKVAMLYSLEDGEYYVMENGIHCEGCYEQSLSENGSDIISEWKEEINEEELDKLAYIKANKKYYDDCNGDSYESFEYERNIFIEGFKAGYRKAKEL